MLPVDRLPDRRLARRSFEHAAAHYDAAAVLQQEVARRLLERLDFMRLQPRRVLDLGCGTGQCIRGLMSRYRAAEVVALDVALPMLAQARQRGRWLRRPRCVCADAESLPFADASFDLVFSNLMLQWCPDPEPVFGELQRVLRPGGLLLFTSFGPDTLRELRDSWSRVDGYTHVNAFQDMHDVGDALVRARFAEPVMDVERLTVTYPDVWQLMRELKQIGAHNVTAGRRRGLTGKARMQRLVQAYEAFRRDGVLPASYEIVNGHAWGTGDGRIVQVPVDQVRRL
jgi:malonyl-CoA O-methyltransferase